VLEEQPSDASLLEVPMPTSPLQMQATLIGLGTRGLQIRGVLQSLSQVMDSVQVHHLALMLNNERVIQEAGLDGEGSLMSSSVGEEMAESLLAEDQGEVHDFEGNNDQ